MALGIWYRCPTPEAACLPGPSVCSVAMRSLSDDGGQSMVELALTLPILVFSLIGGADLARAYAIQLAVQNGARAGAEAAAITYPFALTESSIKTRTIDEMDRTPGMVATNALITVTFKQLDGTTACTDPPSPTTPCYATVRVRYTFRTVTPWPLVPNVAYFDRSTTMRTIKGGTLPP